MPGRSFAFLCAAVLAAACGGSSTTSPGGSTTTTPPTATTAVTMSGLQFTPAAITVSPGSVVTWTNRDNTAHNVTFSNSAITSIGDFSSGSHSATMPQATGTYSYRCTIHPNMNGSIVVQ